MINQFVCILLLLAGAISAFAADGGVVSSSSDHSYLVSLQSEDGSIICGGALINSKTVVTAASCLAFYDADQLVVGVNNGAQLVKIASKIFNADYDFITNENDVAVLKLAEVVNAGSVTLASGLPPTGSKAILSGWDANNSVVDESETIISAKDCVSGDYNYENGDIFDSMLCGLADNGACGELPGSPLVFNNQLVGVVSWGYGCANKANPAVYTSIPALKSWIEQNLNK